ncbi:Alpha-L-arabinofuranosidase 1 [Camellia lanceoleosa]|uniref:Alpha-L-arabinofuranosidase 1 n=1 Tax=Camellia lanceoleosa TaxID=1840588 RepID=A0ACC0G3B9_9ERIC|nr:Alpha-L-arabinofuranosidase 1 [Camellia lanceoleosa]
MYCLSSIELQWNEGDLSFLHDIVEMASYAPLFVNTNDRRWNPDAIVFNSFQQYGTLSYWMQHFFIESSGATLLNSTLKANSSSSLVASAIAWSEDDKNYLRIKSRGSTRDGTGVYDSIVNQVLTKAWMFGSPSGDKPS